MDKEKTIVVLMLMATLLGHIHHSEATKKISKLRKHIRINLNRLEHRDSDYYASLTQEANKVWEHAKTIIADNHFEIIMSETLMALWVIIETSEYREMWFTEKTLFEAIRSMENHPRNVTDYDADKVVEDSNTLVDYLQEALGDNKRSKLAMIKRKVSNELLLEGIDYRKNLAG